MAIVSTILLLALLLRLVNLNQSLWLDEKIQALTAPGSFPGVFYKLQGDFHSPLYHSLSRVWVRIFGSSEVSLRIPSVLFGVGTVYLFYLIGREIFAASSHLGGVPALRGSSDGGGISINPTSAMRRQRLCSALRGEVKKGKTVDLSIVIVNYNTKDLLKNCLESIYRDLEQEKYYRDIEKKKTKSLDHYPPKSLLDYEIIIVDNGSTDESLQKIKNKKLNIKSIYKKLKIIENQTNLGFARANNQALQKAQGKYILFLNPDTLVLNNSLELMVDYLENHPEIGVLSCQILNEKNTVVSSGGYFPNPWRVFLWASALDHFCLIRKVFGSYHPPASFFTKERNLDWVQGCALLARKKILQKIQGFDPVFFMYAEEVELCLRIKKEGWKVVFFPKPKIVHLGGQKKEQAILGEFKGLLLYYQKHFPLLPLAILKLFLKLAIFLRILVFGIIKRDENLKKAYFKAWQAV